MPDLQQEIRELSTKLVENSMLSQRLIAKRKQDSINEPNVNTYNVIDTLKNYVKYNIEIIIYSLHNLALSSESKEQVLIETTIQDIIIKAIKMSNIANKYLDQVKTIAFINNIFTTVHKFNQEKTTLALNKSIDGKLKTKQDINALNNLIIIMKQKKLETEVSSIIAKLSFCIDKSTTQCEQQYWSDEIEKLTIEYANLVENYNTLQKILSFHPDLQNDDGTIKKLSIHTDILERAKVGLAKITAIDETKVALNNLIESNSKEKTEATSKPGFWGVVTTIFEKLTKKPYNPMQDALEMVKNDPTITSGSIENKKLHLPSFAFHNIAFKVGKLSHTNITFSRDEQLVNQQLAQQQKLLAAKNETLTNKQSYDMETQQSFFLRRTSSTPNLAMYANAVCNETSSGDEVALVLGFEVIKYDHVCDKARSTNSLINLSIFSKEVNSEIDLAESKNLPHANGQIVSGLTWV